MADPPLGHLVVHARGLIEDVVWNSFHDYVLARPLFAEPVRALHHDVGVESGFARLVILLDMSEADLKLVPVDVWEGRLSTWSRWSHRARR